MDRTQTSTPLGTDGTAVCNHRAFSLVELVVVLGVVMILVSFLFPGLAGALSQGKLTRDLALMRSHAASIAMYAAEFDDIYPFWGEYSNPTIAAQGWYLPMLEAKYFSSVQEVAPGIQEGFPYETAAMSKCMVYDWKLMRPGYTVPSEEQVAVPVPTRMVAYPSLKGLVFRLSSGPVFDGQTGMQNDVDVFCCGDLWIFPVAMADGSAEAGDYLQFNNGKPVAEEHGIGIPVDTTWFGVSGIDRW